MKSHASTNPKSSRKSAGAGAKKQPTAPGLSPTKIREPKTLSVRGDKDIQAWIEENLEKARSGKSFITDDELLRDLRGIVECIEEVRREQYILRFGTPEPTPNKGGMRYTDGNPKTEFGAVKPGVFYTPPIPLYEYSLAHYQGALKYGHYNWRDDPVSPSTYTDAAIRHINLFLAGQKNASDTGIHHLGHAMTCLSIIIDAEAHGTLIDNRHLTIQYTREDKPGLILEGYMDATKDRVSRINKEWSGHAEAVKAGPEAFKAWKEERAKK